VKAGPGEHARRLRQEGSRAVQHQIVTLCGENFPGRTFTEWDGVRAARVARSV